MVTGVMLIGMITFSTGKPVRSAVVVISADNNENEKEQVVTPTPTESVPTPTEVPTITVTPTPDVDAPNPLLEEIYPDIHELIQKYFDAKASLDVDALKELVTDPVYISIETITAQNEYIKGYSDLKCYTKRGGGEIDFVAYCTFTMSVTTVNTPIASLEAFYISYKDGKPLIFTGIVDENTLELLNALDEGEDVQALKDYTSQQVAEAGKNDPSVYEVLRKLINVVGEPGQEEESGAGSASGTEEESENEAP